MPFVGACGERMPDSAIEPLASWVLQGPLGLLAREITDPKRIRERHMRPVLNHQSYLEADGLGTPAMWGDSRPDSTIR